MELVLPERTQIDRESPQKLYLQLYGIIKEQIERGEWPVESQIPTEEELCRLYEVSKATVRIAVADLVREGYLRRRQGKGTFVCKRVIPEGLSMLTSFKEIMLEAGVVFETRVLAQTVMMLTDELELKLDVPEDRHIVYLKRVRLVGEEPVLLQESYLPHAVCPALLTADLAGQLSVLELLERRCGVRVTRVRDYIELAALAEEEARILGLPPGSPALLLEQYFYAGDAQVMYTRSVKRPERFRLFIELERR
ncbi:MAG TPA: GntR family transcriptional regulator [Candidatus Methanoperedens sp.]|nr:GntR family transcriptional regulator [Candidatus Methanoperedens sp.]